MSFCVAAFEASDTAKPSFTRAAACFRFAGVIRLSAPISSFGPQRPQFESSFCQRSNSAWVTRGCDAAPDAGAPCERTTMPPIRRLIASPAQETINVFMSEPHLSAHLDAAWKSSRKNRVQQEKRRLPEIRRRVGVVRMVGHVEDVGGELERFRSSQCEPIAYAKIEFLEPGTARPSVIAVGLDRHRARSNAAVSPGWQRI